MDAARLVASAVKWGLIAGASGFAIGFFGPMLVAPGASQGPVVSALVAGPLGFLLGVGFGAVAGVVGGRVRAAQAGGSGTGTSAARNGTGEQRDRWAA